MLIHGWHILTVLSVVSVLWCLIATHTDSDDPTWPVASITAVAVCCGLWIGYLLAQF